MFPGIYQGPNADWGVTYFTNIVLKVLTPLTRPGALHLNRVLNGYYIVPRVVPRQGNQSARTACGPPYL